MATAAPTVSREAEIVSILDIPSAQPSRFGKTDVLVTYRVDPLHSFTITMAREDATSDNVQKAIRADWATRKDLFGKKITL